MKYIITIGVLLALIYQKQSKDFDDTNLISNTKVYQDHNIEDFHPLIDLILSHIVKEEKEKSSVVLKVKSNLPLDIFQNDDYILKRLEKQTTKILYNNFKTKVDQFKLDRTKLNLESNELLNHHNNENNSIITYTFNGFLMNQSKNLVISSITVLYSNKTSSKIRGGWHELVLFEKKENTWEVLDQIETIEY
ncbi:hypothetical protein [Aquimarina sp. AU119]|uniref:hypothetical protein n=1 Tax=Aquimarina sp. AU119 TaxID=2108528 RepID=UPI000D686D9A|nr:hypothetical protein [Aquimarina sp. AU119]